MDHRLDAGSLLVSPCQQSGSRRRTNGAGGMEIGEPHSFIGETVDLWSLEVGIAEGTDSFVTHVIDHDDDEVGLVRLGGKREEAKKECEGDAQDHAGKVKVRMVECEEIRVGTEMAGFVHWIASDERHLPDRSSHLCF
jgi:phosphatidylethanolamine-binding protein (PEBP) family uncharacterized protein